MSELPSLFESDSDDDKVILVIVGPQGKKIETVVSKNTFGSEIEIKPVIKVEDDTEENKVTEDPLALVKIIAQQQIETLKLEDPLSCEEEIKPIIKDEDNTEAYNATENSLGLVTSAQQQIETFRYDDAFFCEEEIKTIIKEEDITEENSGAENSLARVKRTQRKRNASTSEDEFSSEEETNPRIMSLRSSNNNKKSTFTKKSLSQVKRKPKSNKNWKYECTFTNKEEAESYINKEKCWSFRFTNKTSVGNVRYYGCNRVKRRGPQCNSVLKLIFDSKSTNIFLHRTEENHSCDPSHTHSVFKLSEEVKSDIEDLYKNNFKRPTIFSHLKEKYADPPNFHQVNYYISQIRKSIDDSNIISLRELENSLKTIETIPSNDYQAFVMSYMTGSSEGGTFRFVVSSKALLKLAVRDNLIIHVDSTYKLSWQGFPIFMIGTSDRNNKFHILAISVCCNNKTADFEYIFQSLKETVKKIYNFELNPKVLITDTSQAIKTAFENIFGTNIVIRTCSTLMRKIVHQKALDYVEKNNIDKILKDIDAIQISKDQYVFMKAYKLFKEKWKNEVTFIKYLDACWYNKNRNWYEGACRRTPSTNNKLDLTYKIIKTKHSFRERLPVAQFCQFLVELLETFSNKYENNPQEFSDEVLINLDLMKNAYVWARLNKKVITLAEDIERRCLVPMDDSNEINESMLIEDSKDNFDKYIKKRSSYYHLTLPTEDEKWKDGECNCPMFFKNFMCMHLLGVAIRLKFIIPPVEVKIPEIGMKRKRGRPPKSQKAIIIN